VWFHMVICADCSFNKCQKCLQHYTLSCSGSREKWQITLHISRMKHYFLQIKFIFWVENVQVYEIFFTFIRKGQIFLHLHYTVATKLYDTWQTRPLVREGAPKRQDSNFEKNNLWSNVPDLGLTPRHTDWLTDRQSQCDFDFGFDQIIN
jgi:hypothetical protein